MIDHSRKIGVTRTGKYTGNYNFESDLTPHERADQKAKERLEEKEKAGTLTEDMKPYLEYLRGRRKKKSKYLSKLRKLINTSGHTCTYLATLTSVSPESLRSVSRGRRGVLSEASSETVYYQLRKRITS